MTGKLAGRVALITGTGGGQGREAALRFAAEGAVVVGCDLDGAADRQTAELVSSAGGRMTSATVDLGDPDAAKAWIDSAAAEHGRIDILYNNASAARFGLVPDLSVEDWRFTLRNELDLVFYGVKFAWPYLIKQGGVIINVASIAGHHASRSAGIVAHSATKAGVIAMTRQIALEGAPHRVRAVSISPGFIQTAGTEKALEAPGAREALVSGIPLGRAGLPKDIAAIAVMIASDEASYLTGTDIVVDGGLTA
ncbi:MAG TPA: SDR family NAD(P)-dependent oxidoreductase [Caulobacteraceae bacterium]|jgi:NAD(P)-dependent dehydrogenase (short-subunit alcohol dehydrogenase family)